MPTLPTGTKDTITNEYRVAVVMYGGVSLAIYMNGISQELLAMVRSTAINPKDPNLRMLDDLKGTEPVYRDLALLLSEEKDDTVHTRFVIDVISGTSAGGINGIFLAKALTQRKDLQSLKRTWVEEGDFQKLLNDHTSDDISLPKQVPPRSLLSGERLYVKLFEAFAEMDQDPGQSYVEDLELSVTTTDLLGKLVPLRLVDRVVWERKYKQVFHLRYSEDDNVNDFASRNTPFLAFAARCTSSFPVAFEPMQLDSIPRLVRTSPKYARDYDRSADKWKESFEGEWQVFFGPPDPMALDSARFFADGGYLDNHPFDHAIESLARLSSATRSERKLLYIEPSPQHPERDSAGKTTDGKLIQPDAIENAWDALAGIPGQQPIRDSLLQIQQRNHLIRKVNNVIGEISNAVEASPITANARVQSGRKGTRDPATVLEVPSTGTRPGYRAYRTLNVYAVTDDLAIRIARLSKISDDSDYVYAIRCLIKEWRIQEYQDKEDNFLLDFDISYRMRKYQFVNSQLEMLSCLDKDAKTRLAKLGAPSVESPADRAEFRKEIGDLRRVLDESYRRIRQASRLAAKSKEMLDKIIELGITEVDLNEILGIGATKSRPDFAPLPVVDYRAFEKRAEELLTPQRKKTLKELRTIIVNHYAQAITQARVDFTHALGGSHSDSQIRKAVLKAAENYFYGFQEFDAAIFPIVYGTDAGELIPVGVVRVSPEDAIAIQDESKTQRAKLAGASFGAFGAFLERVWRTNDILWGRLDGAERIIRSLAGQTPAATTLIQRAHDTIIAEELTPANRDAICQMLVDSLQQAGGDSAVAEDTRKKMLAEVQQCVQAESGSTDINPKLLAVLREALTPDRLRKSLETFEISREPNRQRTLESVARSVRIIGRILEDIGRKRPVLKKPGAVLVQAGSVLWAMVEVATPGAISGAFFTYWFGLLMLFAVVMIVGGTLFSQAMQSLGIRLLVLAFAARLSVSVLRTHIQADKRWKRVLEALFVLVLLALLALGLVELQYLYEKYMMPWIEQLRQQFQRP